MLFVVSNFVSFIFHASAAQQYHYSKSYCHLCSMILYTNDKPKMFGVGEKRRKLKKNILTYVIHKLKGAQHVDLF